MKSEKRVTNLVGAGAWRAAGQGGQKTARSWRAVAVGLALFGWSLVQVTSNDASAGPLWVEDEDGFGDELCPQPTDEADPICPPDWPPTDPLDCVDWLEYDLLVCEGLFDQESKEAIRRIQKCLARYDFCVATGGSDCAQRLETCLSLVPSANDITDQHDACRDDAFDDYYDCLDDWATDPGTWGVSK